MNGIARQHSIAVKQHHVAHDRHDRAGNAALLDPGLQQAFPWARRNDDSPSDSGRTAGTSAVANSAEDMPARGAPQA